MVLHLINALISLAPFWHSMYWGHPWYTGQVWGNIFVVFIAAPVGWVLGKLWSRSKYWPLKPLERAVEALHVKHDAHAKHLDELHAKIDALHAVVTSVHGQEDPPGDDLHRVSGGDGSLR
jgi:hypothetical protein